MFEFLWVIFWIAMITSAALFSWPVWLVLIFFVVMVAPWFDASDIL